MENIIKIRYKSFIEFFDKVFNKIQNDDRIRNLDVWKGLNYANQLYDKLDANRPTFDSEISTFYYYIRLLQITIEDILQTIENNNDMSNLGIIVDQINVINESFLVFLNEKIQFHLIEKPNLEAAITLDVSNITEMQPNSPESIFTMLKYEGNGVFTYKASFLITPLWYRKMISVWEWTPHDPFYNFPDLWMTVPTLVVPKGIWAGEKPAFINQNFITWLYELNPEEPVLVDLF